MRGRGVKMPMKDWDVVDSAGNDQRHDGDPHAVNDVALHRAVDEYTVADVLVVREVTADDRWTEVNDDDDDDDDVTTWRHDDVTEVNDDTGDVDDADTEHDAADAHTSLNTDILFTVQHTQRYTADPLN